MKIEQIKLEGARIVKFEPKYAASIADMWNASAEGWNGDMWDMTEQQVLNEETTADSLVLYLVIDNNEKVLGYCKLEEYKDKKAVYIPLLNVIPAFWGRKYGKALLLKALEKTIQQGYNRLDLHSWSGNTKAVPLYKKTGFCWQTSNSSMYMMNYLPLLLNLELLQPWFAQLDWYADLACDLCLEPDGKMEDGFEYFHYCWKKDDLFLEAVINADAKGLCQIRCNDFDLKLLAGNCKVFYGKAEVQLEMTSNLAGPLNIEIEIAGEADIIAAEKRIVSLTGCRTESFWIEVIDDYEIKDHESPAVIANLKINGKSLPLKLGLKPQAPVKVNLKAEMNRFYNPGVIDLYLQLKNNLKEIRQFSTVLIDSESLHFEKKEVSTELQPLETQTIMLQAKLEKGCFYDERIKVDVASDTENVSYNRRLRLAIPELDTIIYGEGQDYWFMQKGSLRLSHVRKGSSNVLFINVLDSNYWLFMRVPKLSKPYDKEFTLAVPESVSFENLIDGVLMKLYYSSGKGHLRLCNIFKMKYNNIVEHNFEIENISDKNIDLQHLETCYNSAFTHAVYDGKLLKMTEQEKNQNWFKLESDKILPGWYYYQTEGLSVAVSWSASHKLKFGEWWQRVLYEVGELKPGEKRSITGEVYIFNQFQNWQDYYYWHFGNRDYPDYCKVQELLVNEGNPFCDEDVSVRYSEMTDSVDERTLKLYGDESLLAEDKYVSGAWQQKIAWARKLKLEIEEASQSYSFKQTTFRNCLQQMQFSEYEEAGNKIVALKGEKLELKTGPDFFAGVFSLKYKDKEILSSSFPETIIRGWSNHWRGGIYIKPYQCATALLEQQEFVLKNEKRLDNWHNTWQGFSYTVKFNEKVPHLEGLTVRYNYLASPSQDVIALFSEILDTAGAYFTHFCSSTDIHITEEQPVHITCDDTILKISERSMRKGKLQLADAEFEGCNFHLNFFPVKDHLSVSVGSRMGTVDYNSMINNIPAGEIKVSQPLYIVLSDDKMTAEELQVLKNIKWS
ncbi:MAG: GNAT family N-acetyltransferase [Candidatus Cloacimonetes bacterium]|nr:GNAT family N-acetyltransferase [Candidatus Cloacimonadota bacterium]